MSRVRPLVSLLLAGALLTLFALVLAGGSGADSADARTPRPTVLLAQSIVSPPPRIPLRFSHALHRGPKFACTRCHAQAADSVSSSDLLLPKKSDCLPCHQEARVPDGFGRPGRRETKSCRKCHTRFLPNGFPVRVRWKAPRFRFPHKLHVKAGASCLSCHRGVDEKTRSGRLHLPKMSACFGCHGAGHKASPGGKVASARCVTCHERIPGGRMRTHFPEGVVRPGASLPQIHHTASFKRDHKRAARSHAATCRECHEKSSCVRCHGGTTRPQTIHVGNVILLHGRQARANRKSCSGCHTTERFCLRCHTRLGLNPESTRSPFRLPGIRKFHGARWASTTSTARADNRHAIHARRNATVCTACHRESSCLSCHSSRRLGGLGRNPHGPGFAGSRRCRVLARRNRRSCAKCHRVADPTMRCR